MLTVHLPDNCRNERTYIVTLVLQEFLGLPVRVCFEVRTDVKITAEDGRTLSMDDSFFHLANKNWLERESSPGQPIHTTKMLQPFVSEASGDPELPVVYGKPLPDQQYIQVDATSIKCGVDLLGSSFFLLTRYEELLTPARDQHGRFPAGSSVAARAGFLQRPLVDEYVELLWLMLKQLWPQLPRRENRYQFLLSHDVDAPFAVAGRSPAEVTLSIGYFLLRRLSYSRARQRLSSAWNVYRQGARVDPYNTFPYIMSLSERHGLHSTFNFITHRRAGRFDGNYSLRSPIIRNLMKAIFQRGHKIGLHPGYTTFRDCTKVAQEFDELRVQCKGLGIRQTSWGGRQHFLRWENPTTWRAWDSAGIHYDSSLGFHDAVGFRCGTCREYPTYDLIRRQALRLRERPLIAMECALTWYGGQTWESCCEEIIRMSDICRRMGGNFTLLWHNDQLVTEKERRWYETIVNAAA